jgi:hypothetical protein
VNQWDSFIDRYFKASIQIPIAPTYRVCSGVMMDVLRYLKYFKSPIDFEIYSRKNYQAVNSYDVEQYPQLTRCSIFFDIYRYVPHVLASCLFDAKNRQRFKTGTLRHVFTREGWRLILTRTETGEEIDLGFVNADGMNADGVNAERAIRDVSLPTGGYELSVRSSSLFWDNIFDRVKRTFIVQPEGTDPPTNQPIIGLPPIYDLGSSVSGGVTTIRWSCDLGEFLDCEFWVWFSENFSVDTADEPTRKVPRQTWRTEYAIEITQNHTLRCAVQVVDRSGNLRGEILETVLPWKNTPAQRPQDQIAERGNLQNRASGG